MKFEFQQRGYVHLHEVDFIPNGHDLFKMYDETLQNINEMKGEIDKIHDVYNRFVSTMN